MKHQTLTRSGKLQPSQRSLYLAKLAKAAQSASGQQKARMEAELNRSF